MAYFAWSTTLGKILTMDNLKKRHVIVVDWCCMCKNCGESMDHLLLYCEMTSALSNTIFNLVRLAWVMHSCVVVIFACWKGHFDRLQNAVMWKMVPSCIMYCLWRKRNDQSVEEREWMMVELNDFFFKTFYHWTTVFDLTFFSSIS